MGKFSLSRLPSALGILESSPTPMLPASLLVLAVVIFRCAVGASDDATLRALANFSPLAAIALCSGALFPRKWALLVPIAAQVLSDIGLQLLGKSHAISWSFSAILVLAYVVIAAVGVAVKKQLTPSKLLGASLVGTLLFYVITNTFSFWQDPGYAKTLGGWIQALTTGIPGYPPTYVFLFKSLGGDLFFTSLIALLVTRPQATPAAEAEEEGESDAEPSQA